MFNYYSNIIFIGIILMSIMLTILFSDEILEKRNKLFLILSFVILILSSALEWVVVYLELISFKNYALTTFIMAAIFFATPSIPVFLAWSIDDSKSKKLNITIISILFLNFILPFSSIFSDVIFYYDKNNTYHRGEYFMVYVACIIISIIVLFLSMYKLGKKYQNNKKYILFLIFFLLLCSTFIHFATDIDILWISSTIVFSMVYIYYSSLVNQIDTLTHLLNRRCFEAQLHDMKSDAKILFFDVDKFKEINDAFGHSFGDNCLKKIGYAIKNVYGNYGFCYRIGGDEFSVILIKKIETIEDLNSDFNKILKNHNTTEIPFPTVSLGYGNYYANNSSIQKVLEDADTDMYNKKVL